MRFCLVLILGWSTGAFANTYKPKSGLAFKFSTFLTAMYCVAHDEDSFRKTGLEEKTSLELYFDALRFSDFPTDNPRAIELCDVVATNVGRKLIAYIHGPYFKKDDLIRWLELLREMTKSYKSLTKVSSTTGLRTSGSISKSLVLQSVEEQFENIRLEFNKLVDPCNESLQ